MRAKALTLLLAAALAPAAAKVNPSAELEPRQMRPAPTVYSSWPFDASEARRRQGETAQTIGRPIEMANSIGMKLRLIPAGAFMMGSPEDEKGRGNDEGPVHRVRITKPFYLGVYEVTVGQFRKFVDATGYKTEAETDGKGGWGYTGTEEKPFKQDPKYTWRDTGFSQSADSPVVDVSWNDAAAFCEWLGRKEGMAYRLPTEAQWEYACRAGTLSRYSHGDAAEGLAEVGNVSDTTANKKFALWMTISAVDRQKMGTAKHSDGYVFTAPVGRFRANAFGLIRYARQCVGVVRRLGRRGLLSGFADGRPDWSRGRLVPRASRRQLVARLRVRPVGGPPQVPSVRPEQPHWLPCRPYG